MKARLATANPSAAVVDPGRWALARLLGQGHRTHLQHSVGSLDELAVPEQAALIELFGEELAVGWMPRRRHVKAARRLAASRARTLVTRRSNVGASF